MIRKITVLLVCLLLFVSCGKEKTPLESGESTSAPPQSTAEPLLTVPVQTDPPVFSPSVVLKTETEQLGGASYRTWRYPVVVAEGYVVRCENINAAVFNAVTALGKKLIPGISSLVASGSEVSCETERCDYRLLGDNAILSVSFYLTARVDSNAPEHAFGTANIDLTTGMQIGGAQLITDLSKLLNAIASGDLTRVDEGDVLTPEEFSSALSQYRADYAIYPDVYFAEEEVIVAVELLRTEGSFALFAIPYAKASDYIASEFLVH